MNARAGVVTAQVAWIISLPLTVPATPAGAKGAVAGMLVAAFASFLPDICHPGSTAGRYIPAWIRRLFGGHRMLTHSLLAMGSVWWSADFLLENRILANAMLVGWATHVLLDMLTVQGVGLFYPLLKTKIRIGWMVTGSKSEDRFVFFAKIVGFAVAILYGYLLATGLQGN